MIQCKYCDSVVEKNICLSCGSSSLEKSVPKLPITNNQNINSLISELKQEDLSNKTKQDMIDQKVWNFYITHREERLSTLIKKHTVIFNNQLYLKGLGDLDLNEFPVVNISLFDQLLGKASLNYSFSMNEKILSDFKDYCSQHGLIFKKYWSSIYR